MGLFGVSTWVRYPLPLFWAFPPLWEHAKWRCDTPPQEGYLSGTCAIPYENKANGCDTPLCDTISKGYCAIGGGISHWAAKRSPYSGKTPWFLLRRRRPVNLGRVRQTLSVPKNRNRRKSLRFQIAMCKIASSTAEIAEKSPENRREHRRKIAAISWGEEQKSRRFHVFKLAAFSGH